MLLPPGRGRLPGAPAASVTIPQGGPARLVVETLRTPGQLWCKRVAPPRGPRPGGLRRSTGRQLFSLPPVPQGAGPSIREQTRIANPRTKGQEMHVHAPHDIAVAHKATAPTGPVPSSRLLLPVTSRTVAAGSPLTATEARDAHLFTLLLQILLVFAVFPLAHALVVMAPLVLVAHPVRIAHVECLHPRLLAEVDCQTCALVPQVAHPALVLAACALFGVLQAPPALGAFLAAGLQARESPERHVGVPLEAAHAAPGDDQPLACAGRHRRLVDLSQINGSLNRLIGRD